MNKIRLKHFTRSIFGNLKRLILDFVIGKLSSMFGITWIYESTLSTLSFWNLTTQQLFPIQIYHPNQDKCKIILTSDFKDLIWKKECKRSYLSF